MKYCCLSNYSKNSSVNSSICQDIYLLCIRHYFDFTENYDLKGAFTILLKIHIKYNLVLN